VSPASPTTPTASSTARRAKGYDVLSITNHDLCTFSERLVDYAADRGIVLIQGAEATIEGRHVLIYNFDVSLSMLRTFADLRRYKTPNGW